MLQLDLGIKPEIHNSFDNFIIADDNKQLVFNLKKLVDTKLEQSSHNFIDFTYLYLWGSKGAGKTHLLQAIYYYAADSNNVCYLNCHKLVDLDVQSIEYELEQLVSYNIICLDNINIIADRHLISNNSRKIIEEKLFSFYNQIKDHNKILLITSNCSVSSLEIDLPDLKSRLAWGISYNIKPLSDLDKKKLLRTRAYERGMTLSDELAQYLITHGKRDIAGLFNMLDKLDQYSLRYKRKLTIPFAKEILFLNDKV